MGKFPRHLARGWVFPLTRCGSGGFHLFRERAGRPVARSPPPQRRLFPGAHFARHEAARMEATARRWPGGARDVALEHDALLAPIGIGHRNRREQRERVWMAWRSVER